MVRPHTLVVEANDAPDEEETDDDDGTFTAELWGNCVRALTSIFFGMLGHWLFLWPHSQQ